MGVEILWWLAPPVLVTGSAMVWATWMGRAGRGEVDRDVAVERLARALAKDHPGGTPARSARVVDRSTGIAVRPTRQQGASGESTRRVS